MRRRCQLVLLVGCLACDRAPEPEPMRAQPTPAAATAKGAAPSASAAPAPGIVWNDPPAWKRVATPSPMRKASYRIPRAKGDGEDAELGVFQFGSQGGGVEANMERWIKQFAGVEKKDVVRSERSANGIRIHFVEIKSGTYHSGMPGGPTRPKEGFALLGAIAEAPGGSWFFKLTGPKATVAAARTDFMALVDSIKKQ